MQTEQILISHIVELTRYADTLSPDDDLLDGVLDSLDVMDVALFIDERFNVRMTDDELVPANFASVAQLAAFVERRRAEGAAPVSS